VKKENTQKEMTPSKRLLKAKEAASYLGMSTPLFYGLQIPSRLPKVTLSKEALYDRYDLDDFIEKTKSEQIDGYMPRVEVHVG